MAAPNIYLPKASTNIFYTDSPVLRVNSLDNPEDNRIVQAASNIIGDAAGSFASTYIGAGGEVVDYIVTGIVSDILGKVAGGQEPGPEQKRSAVLVKKNLPPNAVCNVNNRINDMVTASGVINTGVLMFIKAGNDWHGPFTPRHDFGHCYWKEPGHTGVVGGDVVIQSEFCNWGDYRSLDVQFRAFFTLT